MAAEIGRSTDSSTATKRMDLPVTGEPASFRYNNPGAQYPSARAARFGQIGYGIIGGGHKIACFPHPVNGAAANFDLLYRNYVGMAIGAAGKKWTGAHGFGVPGYDSNTVLTKQTLDEPKLAIAFLKAIAGRESGKGSNLGEEDWQKAHAMFKAGAASAFLEGKTSDKEETSDSAAAAGPTGRGLLRRARKHIGERYVNVQVPKDDPNWTGPWDCAEFMSWLVYQEAKTLYGCTDNKAKPSQAEAYTGAWHEDVIRIGKRVSVQEAASTVGGILLRYPPSPGAMGHIVLCDGEGGTVEAMSKKLGVVASTVHGRRWDTGVLIPGISYDGDDGVDPRLPAEIYRRNESNMDREVIRRIQEALAAKGFLDRSAIDGEFEQATEDAVVAFQKAEGLVVDGEVGPDTAGALGISLNPQDTTKKPNGEGVKPVDEDAHPADGLGDPLLGIAISLLPGLATALVGDKAGAIASIVRKLVIDAAGASNPQRVKEKLEADQSAKAMLTLKLAEIEAAEGEKRRKAQIDLLKEQNAAEATKQEAKLEELRIGLENTRGARAAYTTLAMSRSPMAWGAPLVSFIVTVGFFVILIVLMRNGMPTVKDASGKEIVDNQVAQIINITVGALAAAFATVVSFWLGSSQSSKNKDELFRETTAAAIESQNKTTAAMKTLAEQPRRAETVTIVTKPTGEKPKSSSAIDRCVDIVLKYETDEALKKQPLEEAREIYRTRFWNVLRCDDLPAGVDLVVFDFAVEAGVAAAAKALQDVVGAKADGSIGPATIGAAKAMAPSEIVKQMSKHREKAGKGQIDRIEAVEKAAAEMAAATSPVAA